MPDISVWENISWKILSLSQQFVVCLKTLKPVFRVWSNGGPGLMVHSWGSWLLLRPPRSQNSPTSDGGALQPGRKHLEVTKDAILIPKSKESNRDCHMALLRGNTLQQVTQHSAAGPCLFPRWPPSWQSQLNVSEARLWFVWSDFIWLL